MTDKLPRIMVQAILVVSALAALTIFFETWVFVIKTLGWVAGLSIGWLPASFAAGLAGAIALYAVGGLALAYRVLSHGEPTK